MAHRAPLSVDIDQGFAVGAGDCVVDARPLHSEDVAKVGGCLCATLRARPLRTLPRSGIQQNPSFPVDGLPQPVKKTQNGV